MRPRTRLMMPLVLIALAAGLGAACGSSDDGAASPPDPAATEEGRALYLTSCASCHGDDLRGTDRGPSHLSRVYEPNHHGDEAFRSAIANGSPQHHWAFGDMAPVPGLSPAEVDAIIAFVRETQETEGLEG